MEEYSINISVEKIKYPHDSAEIVDFRFSHYTSINYKLPWQPEFLSDGNEEHNFLSPLSIDAMRVIWKESAS